MVPGSSLLHPSLTCYPTINQLRRAISTTGKSPSIDISEREASKVFSDNVCNKSGIICVGFVLGLQFASCPTQHPQ